MSVEMKMGIEHENERNLYSCLLIFVCVIVIVVVDVDVVVQSALTSK